MAKYIFKYMLEIYPVAYKDTVSNKIYKIKNPKQIHRVFVDFTLYAFFLFYICEINAKSQYSFLFFLSTRKCED